MQAFSNFTTTTECLLFTLAGYYIVECVFYVVAIVEEVDVLRFELLPDTRDLYKQRIALDVLTIILYAIAALLA
jgi:hypothetical protein